MLYLIEGSTCANELACSIVNVPSVKREEKSTSTFALAPRVIMTISRQERVRFM